MFYFAGFFFLLEVIFADQGQSAKFTKIRTHKIFMLHSTHNTLSNGSEENLYWNWKVYLFTLLFVCWSVYLTLEVEMISLSVSHNNNNNNYNNNNNGLLTDPLGGSSLLNYINYNYKINQIKLFTNYTCTIYD